MKFCPKCGQSIHREEDANTASRARQVIENKTTPDDNLKNLYEPDDHIKDKKTTNTKRHTTNRVLVIISACLVIAIIAIVFIATTNDTAPTQTAPVSTTVLIEDGWIRLQINDIG